MTSIEYYGETVSSSKLYRRKEYDPNDTGQDVSISRVCIAIAVIIIIILGLIMFYMAITHLPRIRPKMACTSEGYCSTDIVPQTLSTIEDKLVRIARIYAIKHGIDPNSIKFNVSEGVKSYVEHKKDIYLCVRSKENIIYKDNTLIEVGIHELAHVISPEWCRNGVHTENFRKLFAELLDIATEEGYYNPSIPMENNYCGYKRYN